MRIRLVGHGIRKAKVLLSRPDAHLTLLLGVDLSRYLHGVPLKAVEAHKMVRDRREVAAEGVQVGGAVQGVPRFVRLSSKWFSQSMTAFASISPTSMPLK